MEKIIFATGNKGKAQEVKDLFKNAGLEVYSLSDLGFNEEIIEDGNTFEENAFIKAKTIYNKYKVPVIADDSGLVVEQLNGKPGIYSARYAGEECTFEDNNKKIIRELAEFDKPHKAKFICCAVYFDDKKEISETGEFLGEIVNEFRGTNGFGYDPIFLPEGSDKTLAEMTLDQKNKISHRAIAFQKLKNQLVK